MPKDDIFQNVEKPSKAISIPVPTGINDIDTDKDFYSGIIDSAEASTLDMSRINAFTAVSQSRDNVYTMIDNMGEDAVISQALDIYAADVCEPNDKGEIVLIESEDEKALAVTSKILDNLNIDKNAYSWVYSLIKYGDLYLRLYRDSEYVFKPDKQEDKKQALTEALESDKLDESLFMKIYSADDHYAEYAKIIKNPAEMFDLQKFGKTMCYIKSNVLPQAVLDNNIANDYSLLSSNTNYNFNNKDIEIYPATDFVHASLSDSSTRITEEVSISTDRENKNLNFEVRRGRSLLYSAFKIWREVSLLENAIMLNRISKSSVIRAIQIETSGMDKSEIKKLISRVKSLFEQKSAIGLGATMNGYANAGPVENTVYIPVKDQKGSISATDIGGDMQSDPLTDLEYFKTKMLAALGIPKSYLGFTEDSTGFNGGSSLSLISSQFAKRVKFIQNAFCQAITDAVNLILLDKGQQRYINKFTVKMQSPTTQEEKDRKESISSSINNIREIMSLLDPIENQATKLRILKSLLTSVVTDADVFTEIQNAIDNLENQTGEEAPVEEFEDFDTDGMDVGDFGATDDSEPMEELPTPDEAGMGAPQEDFTSGEGEELLTEGDPDYLPNFNDLGVSFNDV